MAGIIGKKIGMTSVFSVEGKNIPCTVIEAGPCVVTQVKTEETDGYNALQLAYGDKKEKHATKAEFGHFKKAGVTPKRPEATCLILELSMVPKREASSPPSPELLLAPILFIAAARHS